MITLIAAAALAAQTAPAADTHAQHAPRTHEQHQGMKEGCCKDCCKEHGEHKTHSPEAKPKRSQ